MVIFLANIGNIRLRRLHRRIKERFQTDSRFSNTRQGPASPRDPGPFRVTTETNPQVFLTDQSYPEADARLEVGFDDVSSVGQPPAFHYWFNWIEPNRDFSLCWHQDTTHRSLGPVHMQVNYSGAPVEHCSARHIDDHPMAILSERLDQLPAALNAVQWTNGQVVGINR